jgi:hypothetical protein
MGIPPRRFLNLAFGAFITDETERWAKVIRAANIKAE